MDKFFSLRRLLVSPISAAAGKSNQSIARVRCRGDVVVLITINGSLLKSCDENNEGIQKIVDIPVSRGDEVCDLFVDKEGRNCIVTTRDGDTFYVPLNKEKSAKKLSRLQGSIECVAFDASEVSQRQTSNTFLVGTGRGAIYEIAMDGEDQERFCRLLYQLENNSPITSLAWYCLLSRQEEQDVRYFVMCATTEPTRLYHFLGGPTLQDMFAAYSQSDSLAFTELPGEGMRAEISTFRSGDQDFFMLTTGLGVYHGALQLSNPINIHSSDSVIAGARLTPYAQPFSNIDKSNSDMIITGTGSDDDDDDDFTNANDKIRRTTTRFDESSRNKDGDRDGGAHGSGLASCSLDSDERNKSSALPIAVAASQFHFFQLFDVAGPSLVVMSRLHGGVVQCETPTEFARAASADSSVQVAPPVSVSSLGTPIGLVADSSSQSQSYWMYTDNNLFQLISCDEDRLVWRAYLNQAESAAASAIKNSGRADAAAAAASAASRGVAAGSATSSANVGAGDGKGAFTEAHRLYALALQYCKTEHHRALVLKSEAECYLHEGITAAALAAECYLKSGAAFDEVVLRLTDVVPTVGLSTDVFSASTSSADHYHGSFSTRRSLRGAAANPWQRRVCVHTLKIYLEMVLKSLPIAAKSQRTMVATWLNELLLHDIFALPDGSDAADGNARNHENLLEAFKEHLQNHKLLVDPTTFQQLLQGRRLQPQLQLQSSAASSAQSLSLFFGRLVGDYEGVVTSLISTGQVRGALSLLFDAPIGRVEAMLYKVLPSLMDKEPEATVEMMLSKLSELQLNLVLPALLDFEDVGVAGREGSSDGRSSSSSSSDAKPTDTKSDKVHHSIRFLQEYINRAFEELRAPPADVLQALLWLLVRFDDPQEGKLVALLTKLCEMVAQDATDTAALFSGSSGSCFDLEYVYRECHRRNRRKAAALLLAIKACKNRHQVDLERAVQAALAVDVEFGKIVCRMLCTIVLSGSLGKQYGSEKVKKSLWLQVANVLISGTERSSRSSVGTSGPSVNSNSSSSGGGGGVVVSSGPSVGVVGALKLLEDCGGVLQIEDLLPLLPDFTELGLLKDELCRSLDRSSGGIEEAKGSMDNLADAADTIVKELEGMKKRGFGSGAAQRCEHCFAPLYSRATGSSSAYSTLTSKAGISTTAAACGVNAVNSSGSGAFYLFPCSHGFHSDCLMRSALKGGGHVLEDSQISVVRGLEEQIRLVAPRASEADKRAQVQLEYLQAELDGYIAADCPLCGLAMIRSLEIPLIGPDDASEISSWAL